jgi:hypothetical protein
MDSRNLYVNFLIIMKPKNLNNFKRLYYKTDKEQIMQIMHHLNIKYLLSLYKKAIHDQHVTIAWTWDCPTEDEWKTAYVKVYQMVNYDGCRFQASVKTLKDELKRREEIGELIPVNCKKPNGQPIKIDWKINKNYKKQ